MSELKYSVEDCLDYSGLPSYDFISSLSNIASELLENEIADYRVPATDGNPGSLIELKNKLPSIIVPDIHARPEFIKNILNYSLPDGFCKNNEGTFVKCSVKEALEQKLINVICVGDAIHTELTSERWNYISAEFDNGIKTGPVMKAEMREGLSIICALMCLKLNYPENFHFIKGNHENILNENDGGDYAFCKYADEGFMVKEFISEYYGEDVLYLISCWEKALPLVVAGHNFVVSHGEPLSAYTRQQLVDARFYGNVVNGLIWTKNGDVKENTSHVIMKELLSLEESEKSFYFAGHRPVSGNYALRQEGRFIQIHNPRKQNIALVSAEGTFDPDKDIVGVDL